LADRTHPAKASRERNSEQRAHRRAKLATSRNAWLFASFDGEFSDRSQSCAGKRGARVAW